VDVVARPQAAQLGNRVSFPARAKRIFLYLETSTLALEPTQPPIEWVSGTLSAGYSERTLKVGGENEWRYTSTPSLTLIAYGDKLMFALLQPAGLFRSPNFLSNFM